MKRILTPKRNRDAKGSPLNVSISIGHRMNKRIQSRIDEMIKATERDLKRLFDGGEYTGYAMDENTGSQARILMSKLWKRFEQLFRSVAYPITKEMVRMAEKDSAASLKASMGKIVEGFTLPAEAMTPQLQEIIAASSARSVALIKRVPAEYLGPIEQAVYQSITTGRGLADLKPFLEKQGVKVKNWAHNVSMDQTRKVYNDINAGRMTAIGVDEYEWVHSGGSNQPREYHRDVLNGKRFKLSAPPIIDQRTKVRGKPGDLIHCFPGETEIFLANGCKNLWRHWYEGELIYIVVGGHAFQSTPHHPILTARGWVPAHEIEEGDYLASSEAEDIYSVKGEIQEAVTSFDDFFISNVRPGNRERRRASEFNFHGDIPEYDVDCVSIDNNLPLRFEAIGTEDIEKLALSLSDGMSIGPSPSLVPKIFDPCRPGFSRKSGPLLPAQFAHPEPGSFATIPNGDPYFLQNFSNSRPADIVSVGQRQHALPGLVKQSDVISLGIDTGHFFRIRDRKSGIYQRPSEMIGAALVESAKSSHSHTVIKRFLRVSEKRISVSHCFVFSLEAEINGWFNLTRAGLIVKNCRCRMRPIVSFKPREAAT